MTGYIITAIIFSIPTVYYRIRLRQCEEKKKRIIQNSWKWNDWGE